MRFSAYCDVSLSPSLPSLVFVLNGSQYNSMLMLSLWKWMNSRKKPNNVTINTLGYPMSKAIVTRMCCARNVCPESMIQRHGVCVYVYLHSIWRSCLYLNENQNRTWKKEQQQITYNNGINSSYNNSSYCASGWNLLICKSIACIFFVSPSLILAPINRIVVAIRSSFYVRNWLTNWLNQYLHSLSSVSIK